MLIYDWEIFKHNCLLGVLDVETNEIVQLWDIYDIKTYTKNHLNEIWVRI